MWGGENFLKIAKSTFLRYPMGRKFQQNNSILHGYFCQAMAKSMEHLTDSVFMNMANVTLLRRDWYLAYLKAGIKADTLAALRTAPLQITTLFRDPVLKQAEEDISNADKGRSGSVYKKNRYHPYERQDNKSDNRRQDRSAWKNISRGHNKRNKGKHQFSSRPAKGQQPYK